MSTFQQRREERIKRSYQELRESDPDTFNACVQAAEAIAINHYKSLAPLSEAQRLQLVADIETALISIASRSA